MSSFRNAVESIKNELMQLNDQELLTKAVLVLLRRSSMLTITETALVETLELRREVQPSNTAPDGG